jgi:hypothetical protein
MATHDFMGIIYLPLSSMITEKVYSMKLQKRTEKYIGKLSSKEKGIFFFKIRVIKKQTN